MAKPFRKMEVLLNGSNYVLVRDGAEQLLAALNRQAAVCTEVLLKLREDLRVSLATETEEPAAVWVEDETDRTEATEGTLNAQVVKDVAKENAEACGDCRVPRCRFCDQPGGRSGGRKDAGGKIVERYYVCQTPNCIAAKMATPQPAKLFTGGEG